MLHTSCVLGDCSQCPATGRLPRAASCVGGAAPPPQPTRAAVATTSSARQRVRGSRDSSNSARTCLHAHAHRRTHTRRSRLPCLLRCTVRIAAAAVARWRDAASRPLAPHAALLVSPALRSVCPRAATTDSSRPADGTRDGAECAAGGSEGAAGELRRPCGGLRPQPVHARRFGRVCGAAVVECVRVAIVCVCEKYRQLSRRVAPLCGVLWVLCASHLLS